MGSRVPPMHAQFGQYLVAGSSQERHSVYRFKYFPFCLYMCGYGVDFGTYGQFWGPTYFTFLVQGCSHFCFFPSFLACSGKLGLDVTSLCTGKLTTIIIHQVGSR